MPLLQHFSENTIKTKLVNNFCHVCIKAYCVASAYVRRPRNYMDTVYVYVPHFTCTYISYIQVILTYLPTCSLHISVDHYNLHTVSSHDEIWVLLTHFLTVLDHTFYYHLKARKKIRVYEVEYLWVMHKFHSVLLVFSTKIKSSMDFLTFMA